MTSYHNTIMQGLREKFNERFPTHGQISYPQFRGTRLERDILAFIGEVAETAHVRGKEVGRNWGRAKLAAHVESMEKVPLEGLHPNDKMMNFGYNTAIHDLLAHLRQSTTNPEPISNEVVVQSDAPQGCCGECQTMVLEGPHAGFDFCGYSDCPCHKKAPQGDNKQ